MDPDDEIIAMWLLARLPRQIALSICVVIIVLGVFATFFLLFVALIIAVKNPAFAGVCAIACFSLFLIVNFYKAMDKELPRREKKS